MPRPNNDPALPGNPGHDAGALIRRALLRRPARTLDRALTTRVTGAPDIDLARQQHAAYTAALAALDVEVTVLPEDEAHPDSVFIEDAALLVGGLAVLTRPGAPSRRREPDALEEPLSKRFSQVERIEAPGTLDAGDVLRVGAHFLVGVSSRTNAEGARQLTALLQARGLGAGTVEVPEGLHLKSAVAYLGGRDLLATTTLAPFVSQALYKVTQREDWNFLHTAHGEAGAANCLAINGRVMVPGGYPQTAHALLNAGLHVMALDVSEFEKLDGGLSCLSLRW